QLCRRLDGMPLAIELAAGLLRVLSVDQLADRLDDRFNILTGGSRTGLPRHRTLRAAVEWSYDLLSDEERILFERLSVVAGSFTLDTAEAVCGDGVVGAPDVFAILSSRVAKSLLGRVDV